MKKLLISLSVVLLFLGFSTKIHAGSVDDYLTDGKLVVNSIKPNTLEEAYDYIGSYLMTNEEIQYGMIESDPGCNADYSTCTVVIAFKDGTNSTKVVDIVYQPTNSTVKSKVDSLIASIGKFPQFGLNDLEVINYIVFGSKSVSSDAAIKNMMSNYSSELKKKLENSNLTLDFRTATGLGSDGLLHRGLGGDALLRFNDIAYGYIGSAAMYQKNVLYVPTGTSEEQLLTVAQKRINDYLGNDSVVLSEGGDLADLIGAENVEGKLDLLGLDGSDIDTYYILTYGEKKYNFLIVADSTKMITPSLITEDLITKAQITTSVSEIPLDSTISGEILTKGDEYESIIKKLNKKDVEMYDLRLFSKTLNKNITKLSNGTFQIRIAVPSRFEGKDLVVHYVTAQGEIEEHEVTVKDGIALFTTNHFSIYTLGEKVAGVSSEANPDTSDGIIAWFILGGISLLGLAGTLIYRKRFVA